jgi:hypothetical protein
VFAAVRMSVPEPILSREPEPEMIPEIVSVFAPVSMVGSAFRTMAFGSVSPLASNCRIVPGAMASEPEPSSPFERIPSVPSSRKVPPA